MNNNFLIAMCENIEGVYWQRYIDDYNRYGDNENVTRKSWENYEVANDVTQQILAAMEKGQSQVGSVDDLYNDVYGLILDVNENEIAEHIKNSSLSKWCQSWRAATTEAVQKIEAKSGALDIS